MPHESCQKSPRRALQVGASPSSESSLSDEAYRQFEKVFAEWMETKSLTPIWGGHQNCEYLETGGTGDLKGLADRVFQWAASLNDRLR
jgi:hypothetical protein